MGYRSVIAPHGGSVLGKLPGQDPVGLTICRTSQDPSHHRLCRFQVQGEQEASVVGNLQSSYQMDFLLVCCQTRSLTRFSSVRGPVHMLGSVEKGIWVGLSTMNIITLCVCVCV